MQKTYLLFLFIMLCFCQCKSDNTTNEVLRKEQLRILHIGNSFTDNAVTYLPEMAEAAGIDTSDICIYKYTRSALSFRRFLDCWDDNDDSPYYIVKVMGGLSQTINGQAAALNGSMLRSAIKDCTWDVIVIQQSSQYSNDSEQWSEHNAAGWANEMIDTLKKYQPNAMLGMILPHAAYSQNSNTKERYEQIAHATESFCSDKGIDFIIPYGTAVENVRCSDINTTQYGFSYDKHHLAKGVGCYAASAAYFEAVMKPRYGISILGNSYRVTITDEMVANEANKSEFVSVNDEYATICQWAAVYANQTKYAVSSLDNVTTTIPIPSGIKADSRKRISNNQIIIERDGTRYNCAGIAVNMEENK